MIQVVNKRFYKGEGEYIGRPSPLGNPFSHLSSNFATKVASRREAIDKYEDWLSSQDDSSPAKTELLRLSQVYKDKGELTLICWCAPSECHGHVLAKKIQEIVDE